MLQKAQEMGTGPIDFTSKEEDKSEDIK